MIELRHASLVALAAALTLTMLADTAAARGGSHGKGARGRVAHAPAMRPAGSAIPMSGTSDPVAAGTAATKPSSAAISVANSVILPSATPSAAAPTPVSAIGAPAAQATAIAPLSAPATTTVLTAGGATRIAPADPSSTSPTESAPSIAGGGGKSLEDCMSFWESATHMTKAEWKNACGRSQRRLENLKLEVIGLPKDKNHP